MWRLVEQDGASLRLIGNKRMRSFVRANEDRSQQLKQGEADCGVNKKADVDPGAKYLYSVTAVIPQGRQSQFPARLSTNYGHGKKMAASGCHIAGARIIHFDPRDLDPV